MDRALKRRLESRFEPFLRGPIRQRHDETLAVTTVACAGAALLPDLDQKTIELLDPESGVSFGTVTFDEVLVASTDDGTTVGTPVVEGASVTGEVVRHGRDKKVIIFKWKRRKNYRKKQGHRQGYTAVRIADIKVG